MKKLVIYLSVVGVVASLAVVAAEAQKGKNYEVRKQIQFQDHSYEQSPEFGLEVAEAKVKRAILTTYDHPLPSVNQATSADWKLNGFDLANSRYSPLDQINTGNVQSLKAAWIQQITAGGRADFGPRHETVPVVVNGVMYVTDMAANVFALDATTGERIWQFTLPEVSRIRRVTNRGVAYADGIIYVGAGGRLFALDAGTGEPVESFGGGDGIPVVFRALESRSTDPEHPVFGMTVDTTANFGYDNTIAPQYYDGKVFITFNHSENNIPGGLVVAVWGANHERAGEIVWSFNTVPQDEGDEGWEITKDTWVGGVRNGGGVWNTPAIDPELGLIYFAVGNPTPDIDGSGRKGINLFSCCIVALDVNTGSLRWFFQQVHHDIWDYDTSAPVILFDTQVGGRTVKACAQAGKNAYVYFLNRETGQPINPIVEVAQNTFSDVPGEEVWPTQPIPFTKAGVPQEPFVPIFPQLSAPDFRNPETRGIPEQIRARFCFDCVGQGMGTQGLIPVVPYYTPQSANEPHLFTPEIRGGALYAQPGFSPRTGLFYTSGLDRLIAYGALSVGASLSPGDSSFAGGLFVSFPHEERGTTTAYDPATGEMVWQQRYSGLGQAGLLVTGGDLVFQSSASGVLHGFHAATGEELFTFRTGNRIQAPPMTYMVNGKQYVAVAAGDIILAFDLMEQ